MKCRMNPPGVVKIHIMLDTEAELRQADLIFDFWQIPGASAEERMQWTSSDLMGETGEPDKSQDPFQNRTCVWKYDTAS